RPLNKTKGCLIANFATVPPTLVAAVQMDDTGTTRIGKFVFNHPFFIPGTLGVVLAVCFGFLLGSFML
ncbi:C4-dicarboxylate transporter, partial [Salmonella enterica subsp. enterica serovar Typhimurium]|nr:C4-dicarboxylate transporter [Salmonella enterica subsp. enterica serovar Typhimurium]